MAVDHQPQSTATILAGRAAIGLFEAVEQAGFLLIRHADARIFNAEFQQQSVSLIFDDLAAQARPIAERLGRIDRVLCFLSLSVIPDWQHVLESWFDRYQPVPGPPPTRPRSDHNPLNRREYLLRVVRRV